MSLLVDIATQALDPGYATAAARRSSERASTHRPRPWPVVVVVFVTALLVVLAALQTHRRAPTAERIRAGLLAQVRTRTGNVAIMQGRLDRLRSETADLRDAVLASSASGERIASELDTEELAAGTVPVDGPGLRVTVDDAADGRNRVLDRDLQAVVNALWAAGAEAVAVDGQRMTGQSAIRQAGDAILVNFEPVSAPYDVEAVGDPVALETGFGSSPAATRLRAYTQLYGLRFRYDRTDALSLPAAPGITLRYARNTPTATHAGGRR